MPWYTHHICCIIASWWNLTTWKCSPIQRQHPDAVISPEFPSNGHLRHFTIERWCQHTHHNRNKICSITKFPDSCLIILVKRIQSNTDVRPDPILDKNNSICAIKEKILVASAISVPSCDWNAQHHKRYYQLWRPMLLYNMPLWLLISDCNDFSWSLGSWQSHHTMPLSHFDPMLGNQVT